MILQDISLINYKNLAQVELSFSKKINCFFGLNGMGKTNLLDAIYYLSFCKSSNNPIDSQNIQHEQDLFVIQGTYLSKDESVDSIYCGLKRRQKKLFKRNKKEYERLSDHIGLIPLVLISPADGELITGGSEERRRFIDLVISQYDKPYLEALIRYNKALAQRNSLLKTDPSYADEELFLVWEEQMALTGEFVYRKRVAFIERFIPIFQSFYTTVSKANESVHLLYESHLQTEGLLDLLQANRERDRIMGYTLKGIHKDDLKMQLGNYLIKKEGSQGQNKTYLIALKLAQFALLKEAAQVTPILLLDDVFDKLDVTRVEQIIKLVAGDTFGQIFITDTNREHIHQIVANTGKEYTLFKVQQGTITTEKQNS